tara:strand:+ start:525 stop:653 length:129 start_codon:yes stop_codon:yes gene_type:complete
MNDKEASENDERDATLASGDGGKCCESARAFAEKGKEIGGGE